MPDEKQLPGPPGWGFGVGPTTQPCKTCYVTETNTTEETYADGPPVDLRHPPGRMTTADEILPEVRSAMHNLLGPKSKIRLGTWNVRTMYATSKTAQVLNEMENYQLDILGISECRWTGAGKQVTNNGAVILFSGHPTKHEHGVAIIVSKMKSKTLLEWEPISDRLIRARFNSKYSNLTILQCYSPTNEAEDDDKDHWYEELQAAIRKVPVHDVLLVMGDMNAKVGSDNTNFERGMGKHGCGIMNDNGRRFAEFCLENDCVIGGTIFPHKTIHKITWNSPDGKTANQIDHIAVNGKWRRSLQDVRVYRRADVNSDHHLLVASIKLKLRNKTSNEPLRRHLDVSNLKCPKINRQFTIELRNRFAVLADDDDDSNVETEWRDIKNIYVETATDIIGYKKKGNKEWLTPGTWQKIKERKDLKAKMLNTRSPRLRVQVQTEYKIKDCEVKRSARKDKREFVDQLAKDAEAAATRGELSTVYKITKKLCGKKTSQSIPLKNKDGSNISTERERITRWKEHFQEVLNRPEPERTANIEQPKDLLDIDISPPSEQEVRSAIKALKNGKACGIDQIHAEMLKADLDTSTKILTSFYRSVWDSNAIPEDWTKGLIVTLPKKGNLQFCDNWRGITLLSVPSKVFCGILLGRIDSAIDNRLREEQAGFRKGRGCIDQIFTIRNIIEQCLEWNSPLYINFIDFQKAFDSLHRDTLWSILRSYGVPDKLIALIKLFYHHFECSVVVDGNLSEWFPVESGVRQGCIISPILFLVAIDWIMRKTTSDKPRGIQWTLLSHLESLDFADDLAVLSTTHRHLQEKTNRLSCFAKQTGLNISTTKTKTLFINANSTEPILVDGEPLEKVDEFTYLGSIVSTNEATHKDINSRLGKAQCAFAVLRSIWRSKQLRLKTKIRIYNSNVKSVLLYGSECWRVIQSDMKRLDAFNNRCLRRICGIYWPTVISNKDLFKVTKTRCLTDDIKCRRMRWLGHVLRMEPKRIAKVALRWTPPGKRKPGRPRTTWRRTITSELSENNLTLGEAQNKARDRLKWKQFVKALCPSGDEED